MYFATMQVYKGEEANTNLLDFTSEVKRKQCGGDL
jgi:hypothetical protein